MRQLLWLRTSTLIFSICFLGLAQISSGADDLTWTGGGDGTSFSDDGNWTADFGSGLVAAAPSFDFTEDSLKFNSAGTTVNNDLDPATNVAFPDVPIILGLGAGTNADSAALHYQAGSGDFTLTGFPLILGGAAGDTILRTEVGAGATQTIDNDLVITGGNKNREIKLLNGGTAIFNGDLNFTNSRLFPNEGAGRIELNGNNIGVGLGLYSSTSDEVALHTNAGRSVLRNNVAFTTLSLGSDTALGDAGTGSWDAGDLQFRGLQANQILTIETSGGPRDLSGYHFQLANGSGGGAIRFNNTDDASIGYVTRSGNGTRGLSVTGAGVLSIDGGIITSTTDQARDMIMFAGGTGGNVANSNGQLVLNGRLFSSLVDPTSQATNGTTATGGIVAGLATDAVPGKQILAVDGVTPINGSFQFRFGTMTLNGDSSSTWIGSQFIANVGSKIVMGHENAFGDSTSLITVQNNSTIDLNGHTLNQSFVATNNGLGGTGFNGEGAIINSDVTTEGFVASEIVDVGLFSVGGAGDLTLNNVRQTNGVQRAITKVGAGTLTLGGDLANARYGLIVEEGTVRLAKDNAGVAAFATNRFDVVINNGSSVVIANSAEKTAIGSGINDQIDDLMLVNITDGSLDLAGNREGIGRLSGGSTSTVSSSLAAFHGNADARIAIGESTLAAAQGDGAGTWAGTIQDGVSAVSVSVNGGIQQSFTGVNTYSGETIVSSSVVSTLLEPPSTNLIVDGSITGTSKVTVEAGAILSGTGTVASPDWDISGVVSPGGAAPSTSDVLTLDYSSSDGSGFVIIQDNAELNFVLDSGLNNSSIDLLGSSLSTVIIGDAIINLTDLAAGSLTNGDYILVDGDADTTLSLTGTIGLTGLDAYASSSVALVGNDIVLSISNDVAPLPGDFNADGTVDAADYTVYRDNLGQDSSVLNGNGSGSDFVVTFDYNIWASNYGASNSSTTSSAVPEPTSLLLIAAGLAFSGLSRRVS